MRFGLVFGNLLPSEFTILHLCHPGGRSPTESVVPFALIENRSTENEGAVEHRIFEMRKIRRMNGLGETSAFHSADGVIEGRIMTITIMIMTMMIIMIMMMTMTRMMMMMMMMTML